MGREHVSLGFVAGLDALRRVPVRARPPAGAEDAPAGAPDPRGRRARRLGREGDPRGRLLVAARRACRRPARVICGDAAGFVNVPKLKGVHYAMRSGMLAAETIYQALQAPGRRSGRARRARPVRRAGARERDLVRPAPRAQHAPGVPEGPRRRRRARRHDGRHARSAAAGPLPPASPTPSVALFDGGRDATRRPTAC